MVSDELTFEFVPQKDSITCPFRMLHEQSAILYKNHFQTKKHSVGQLPIEQFATFTSSRQGAQMAFFLTGGTKLSGGGGGGGGGGGLGIVRK